MRAVIFQAALVLICVAILATGCRDSRITAGSVEVTPPTLEHQAVFLQTDLGVDRPLAPGVSHLYELELATDKYLHVRIDQRGIDLVTQLLDPSGKELIEVDSHSPNDVPEHLYVVTTASGAHRLVVRAFESQATPGTYEARIVELRDPSHKDRRHAEAEKAFADAYGFISDLDGSPTVPEAAVANYRKAALIWQELGNTDRQAMALFELATIYRNARRALDALPYFEESSKLFSDPKMRALALHESALIWRENGEPTKARQGLEESLALFRALREYRNEATALLNLGRLDSRQGRSLDALERLQQAQKLLYDLGDRQRLVETLSVIGEAYEKLGETELALDHHRQALELLDPRTEPLKRATALSFKGRALLEAGDFAGAAVAYEECLRLRQASGAAAAEISRAWNGLGAVEARRGNSRRAQELFKQALSVADGRNTPVNQAMMLDNLALTYHALGESEQALDLHRQAASVFHELTHHEGEARSYLGMAMAHRQLGQTAEALANAERALALIERVLESGQLPASREDLILPYIATRQPYFDFYIQLLMAEHRRQPGSGYDALALATSEQARARHLLEILAENPVALREDADPILLEKQRVLREQINVADWELRRRRELETEPELAEEERLQRQRRVEYHRLAQRIREESSWYASLHQPRPLALEEIQRLLDAQTLLLEFHLGEERSFLWAVDTGRLQSYELPSRTVIDPLARRTYEELTKSDQIIYRVPTERDLARLSAILLEPVADQLTGQRLLIVTSGALDYIPFAALPIPGSHRRLVEEHEILKVPSASVLGVLRSRSKLNRASPQGLLAILADAVYGPDDPRIASRASLNSPAPRAPSSFDPDLSPLLRIPYSGHEATAIRAIADDRGPVLSALGFEARRDLATSGQLAEYRILHFAAHGILREDYPELSALILSRYDAAGRPIKGRLSLNEIYELNLSAELVVLSACQSALGREVRGEGLMGLPRGFLYAGADRVLASLWKVHDESTAELMSRFYHHLLVEGQPPAAALRTAQLSLLSEPRYALHHWAGFVLQGDWL